MKVDWSQNPEHKRKLELALGGEFPPPVAWASTVDNEGEVLMTIAFHNFGPATCEISVAAYTANCVTREALARIFHYPFIAMGLRRIHSVVRVDNPESLRMTEKLGLKVEGYVRHWYPDCDGIFHGMLKEECKWLRKPKKERNTE